MKHWISWGLTAVVLGACGGGSDGTQNADAAVADLGTTNEDASMSTSGHPGSSCSCDDQCAGDEDHEGVCILGVCMNIGSVACAGDGSRGECPEGSRCWDTDGVPLCWPDCDAFECAGECDSDGSCGPSETSNCDPTCGSVCAPGPCSTDTPNGTCETAGEYCVGGECSAVCAPTNLGGYCPAGSTCTGGACVPEGGCPSWECTGSTCADLIEMPGTVDPTSLEARNAGYYIGHPRYRHLRRDLTMLIQYAACEVHARYPLAGPIQIQDLSQADGNTPGTDDGDLRHPDGTHTGNDMDLAYFTTDGSNDGDIVCGDGTDDNYNAEPGEFNDGYFCTTEENIVNWGPQAYWFAKLASNPRVRVFGVDETLVDDFERELGELLDEGAITAGEAERALSLGYGEEGGWAFHHHHTHMSYDER
jgi:hypothetical protein